MKIAFTICSNNYLAQAKILGDSLVQHNPDYRFIICLVDKKTSEIDYNFFQPHEVFEVENVFSFPFSELWKKYDIVELNTSVKASIFKYLFNKYQAVDYLFYFDPDIMLFNKLTDLEDEYEASDILLTPHILSPIPLDEFGPGENTFLNFGIYNLGFLGVKRTDNVFAFLDWWEERNLKLGFNNPEKGFYVDQLWINLVPLLFKKAKVLFSFGYNAGPWNLHERGSIRKMGEQIFMEDGSLLTFYHFSSYNYKEPIKISKHYNRYTFENTPSVKFLYKEYQNLLLANNVEKISALNCYYLEEQAQFYKKQRARKRLKNQVKEYVPPFITNYIQHLLLKQSKAT